MNTLHMTVPDVEAMLTAFRSAAETTDAQMQNSASFCNSIVGSAWIAPGATQFQEELNQWVNNVRQLCAEWDALNNRLRNEIDQWVSTAQNV